MAPSELAINAHSLARRFGSIEAVSGFSVAIPRGEIFGLVGPDGAGKTTAIRMLAGLVDPDSGTRSVAGLDVASQPDAVKDRIGYMAQRFGLYQDLTVEENMAFYAELFGISRTEREQLSRRLLAMTRMQPFCRRAAGKLSGGMKQKLALMCTLLHKPEVLLLDEPTNGVDPLSRRDFWVILTELAAEGLTVFVTTTYLDEAERCHRVGLMHRGCIIRCDTPAGLRAALPESCYALTCAQPRQARRLLLDLPAVLAAEPAGAVLHVFLKPGHAAGAIESGLTAAGISGFELHPVEPSLEDVFIAEIRRAA